MARHAVVEVQCTGGGGVVDRPDQWQLQEARARPGLVGALCDFQRPTSQRDDCHAASGIGAGKGGDRPFDGCLVGV
jgi:hypothetical protein